VLVHVCLHTACMLVYDKIDMFIAILVRVIHTSPCNLMSSAAITCNA
jgi:hypothetical protein